MFCPLPQKVFDDSVFWLSFCRLHFRYHRDLSFFFRREGTIKLRLLYVSTTFKHYRTFYQMLKIAMKKSNQIDLQEKVVIIRIIRSACLHYVAPLRFIFFYLPYLSSIYEKANSIAMSWTVYPHSLGSCYFRSVWATCLPHKSHSA